jgi:glycosyltransferase
MIQLQYWIHTGRRLNIKNPQRFTEKLQLYKLKYRDPLMLRCTDKYEVRSVIKEFGFADILIPLIGVYDSAEAIDFHKLPSKFVAKTTDGGGGNQVFICRDKSRVDTEAFYSKIKGWLRAPKSKSLGREWAYENRYPRRIIIEELISDSNNKEIPDYKFFCFNGKVRMIYAIGNRTLGQRAEIGIYSSDFKKQDVRRNDELPAIKELPKPENFDKMIEIAERISMAFPHVRVDLYNVEGNIFFGELTFYDGSGYMSFTPDSFDYELGNLWVNETE